MLFTHCDNKNPLPTRETELEKTALIPMRSVARIMKFSVVGASGILVNMSVLFMLTHLLKILYVMSSIVAIEVSIVSNFMLNDRWTWDHKKKNSFIDRVSRYHVSAGAAAILSNLTFLILLTEVFKVNYLLSNLVGIGVGAGFNFFMNDVWTFRSSRSGERRD